MAIINKSNANLISKGVFAVAIVAIAGIVGAVHYASAATNDNTSGYGTTSAQQTAATDSFATDVVSDQGAFTGNLEGLQEAAETQLQNNDGSSFTQFDSSYNTATQTYFTTLQSDFTSFQNQINADANTATSKDQFIDEFNHAKADYLNQLDAAKNTFADTLGQMGNNANQVKDQFINGYNSTRDAYSNALEASKNQFADTISNL